MNHFQPNPSSYPQSNYPPQQYNPNPNSSLQAPLNPQQNPYNPYSPQQNPPYPQHPQQNPYNPHPPQQHAKPYPQPNPYNPTGGRPSYNPPAQPGNRQSMPGNVAGDVPGAEMKVMWKYQIQEAEKSLQSGFVKCYQVYNGILVPFFGLYSLNMAAALVNPNLSWIPLGNTIISWFLIFGIWSLVQSVLAVLSVMKKNQTYGTIAYWLMLVYIIPALIAIFQFRVVASIASMSTLAQSPSVVIWGVIGFAHLIVNVACVMKVRRMLDLKVDAEEKLEKVEGPARNSFGQAADGYAGGNPLNRA